MSYSQFEFESDLESGFEERFADYIDTVSRDRISVDESDTLVPLPQYWQDDLHEIVDGALPIYNRDIVELWLDLGLPDVQDEGLIPDTGDIIQTMMAALYEHGSSYVYELADKYGFDD